ncbi:ABC transporter, ATP-binding protein [hydrothermal vent metagenome]|uniref:ABC transporter, ATP-binding protein n=1 Tax=hydrothermal vent metagenome TaxID=652676 RepID=A0A3B0WXK0_9ZZZZ
MIQLNSINVSYENKRVLSNINLHIRAGQKLALIGHSGSGKSTLLKTLYENIDKPQIKDTAFIPQDYGLVQNLSVFHNVYMGQLGKRPTWYNLINLIKPLAEPVAEVTDILAQLQLKDKLFEPVAQLSGGQQQRTAIARAIIQSGSMLLADEPFSSLDEKQSHRVMTLLCQHFKTLVFSLHDVDIALKYCDRIIGLSQGETVIDVAANDVTRSDLLELYGE